MGDIWAAVAECAISARAEGGRWQGAPRQPSAGQGTGEVCTTGVARASASGQLPQQVRHMHAGCMISAHAKPGTAQVAGGIETAARCGRGRYPSGRWPEHAHWPLSCCHMFKARVLCCNASSKWAVSGRDSQLQRNDHCSDRSWMARVFCYNTSSKWAVSGRDRQLITAVIAAGWRAQLLPVLPGTIKAVGRRIAPPSTAPESAEPRAAPSSEATVRLLTREGSAVCCYRPIWKMETLCKHCREVTWNRPRQCDVASRLPAPLSELQRGLLTPNRGGPSPTQPQTSRVTAEPTIGDRWLQPVLVDSPTHGSQVI